MPELNKRSSDLDGPVLRVHTVRCIFACSEPFRIELASSEI
jgi:hypothetical protein